MKLISISEKPLVFVQHSAGDKFTVYQDGKEVRGIRSIRIDAGVEDFTTHDIEYLTGATEEEKGPEPEITYSVSAADLAELRPKKPSGVKVMLDGKEIGNALDFFDTTEKSANERRAEAIEKAKEFVETVIRRGKDVNTFGGQEGNVIYRNNYYDVEFAMNEDKRTVVALVRKIAINLGHVGGFRTFPEVVLKGIAKCNPSDVFNEHIGKAIALGRAFELDTEKFEQAPQPDEVVPGMVVKNTGGAGGTYECTKVEPDKVWRTNGYYIHPIFAEIISDSEAQY